MLYSYQQSQQILRRDKLCDNNIIFYLNNFLYLDNGNNRIFVSVPRFQTGIPSTFNTVSNREYNKNPILKPYPSWEWHRNSETCHSNRLVSVFRVEVSLKHYDHMIKEIHGKSSYAVIITNFIKLLQNLFLTLNSDNTL